MDLGLAQFSCLIRFNACEHSQPQVAQRYRHIQHRQQSGPRPLALHPLFGSVLVSKNKAVFHCCRKRERNLKESGQIVMIHRGTIEKFSLMIDGALL